jgi:hypothetical protein
VGHEVKQGCGYRLNAALIGLLRGRHASSFRVVAGWLRLTAGWLAQVWFVSGGEDQLSVLRQTQPILAPVVKDDELSLATEQRFAGNPFFLLHGTGAVMPAVHGQTIIVLI